jgi:hypothetical protein
MGRSLWIMDNVSPLQQLAAIVGGTRPATVASGARVGGADRVSRSVGFAANEQTMAGGRGAMPTVHLFQPRDTIRYRNAANPGGNGEPEYPGPGVHIDMWFESAPPADARLDILDAKGQVIRSFGVTAKPAAGGVTQEMRGPIRGQGAASGLKGDAGMQRFTWDARHAGPWTATTPSGGGGGPMAAPGKYTARLTAGGQTQSRSFEFKVDPRVPRDGVTQADLDEQVAFQLKVRDAISDARRLQQALEEAMKKAGVALPGPAVPGTTPGTTTFANPLQGHWAKLVDLPGIYPQPMLISQLQNVARMVGQADQKIGKDAVDRFNDLMKELQSLQTAFKQSLQPTF